MTELKPPVLHTAWWLWRPDLPQGRELNVEVLAEDEGVGFGQWQALGWPHLLLDRPVREAAFTELGVRLADSPPQITGAWVQDGYYKGAGGPGAPPVDGAVFGSYPDAATGTRLGSGPFIWMAAARWRFRWSAALTIMDCRWSCVIPSARLCWWSWSLHQYTPPGGYGFRPPARPRVQCRNIRRRQRYRLGPVASRGLAASHQALSIRYVVAQASARLQPADKSVCATEDSFFSNGGALGNGRELCG